MAKDLYLLTHPKEQAAQCPPKAPAKYLPRPTLILHVNCCGVSWNPFALIWEQIYPALPYKAKRQ